MMNGSEMTMLEKWRAALYRIDETQEILWNLGYILRADATKFPDARETRLLLDGCRDLRSACSDLIQFLHDE